MSDNAAVLDGYTDEVWITTPDREFPALVRPGTDYTETFKAWDMDGQEFVHVPPYRTTVRNHTPGQA
jgi:hypothetical protein